MNIRAVARTEHQPVYTINRYLVLRDNQIPLNARYFNYFCLRTAALLSKLWHFSSRFVEQQFFTSFCIPVMIRMNYCRAGQFLRPYIARKSSDANYGICCRRIREKFSMPCLRAQDNAIPLEWKGKVESTFISLTQVFELSKTIRALSVPDIIPSVKRIFYVANTCIRPYLCIPAFYSIYILQRMILELRIWYIISYSYGYILLYFEFNLRLSAEHISFPYPVER